MKNAITALSFAIATLVATGTSTPALATLPAPHSPAITCPERAPISSPRTRVPGEIWALYGVGDGSTGPTFPPVCRPSAALTAVHWAA